MIRDYICYVGKRPTEWKHYGTNDIISILM